MSDLTNPVPLVALEASTLRMKLHEIIRGDFAKQVLATYVTRLVLIALGLVSTVLIARSLGPAGRGLYAVASAIGALGVQFGTFGLHTANTHFVAQDRQSLPSLLGNTLAVSFGIGGIGALVTYVLFRIYPALAPVHGMLLLLALVWIPFGLAYLLAQQLLLGVGAVGTYNRVEVINRVCALAAVGALIISNFVHVTLVFAAGLITMAATLTWMVYRLIQIAGIRPSPSLPLFKTNIVYGLKAYFAGFFGFLVLRIDLLMVQYTKGAEQSGYYSIAANMADYVNMLPVVVAALLLPKLSAEPILREKMRLVKKAIAATVVLLLPLLCVSVALAGIAVRIMFGRSFLPAVPAYLWLVPGTFFLGVHAVAVQFLNSIGYPVVVVWIWGGCAVLNLVMNLWAIPKYGITGASVVSSICYFLACALVLVVIQRTTRRASS